MLFAGRMFPYHSSSSNMIAAPPRKYNTSFTNYVNVAIAGLCFQMYAEVKNVDELLEMIRTTCLTDYIRLDGQTQPLQLMNPAGIFLKYHMPKGIPTTVKAKQTLARTRDTTRASCSSSLEPK